MANESQRQTRALLGAFEPPLIVPPFSGEHRRTFVLLHGRGSSAHKFGPALLEAPLAAGAASLPATLRAAYPDARFVFPDAPRLRATLYRRSIIRQWYDGSGDWEDNVLGHLGGTVRFLHRLLHEEISLLGGEARRVVFGGLSQGCAASLVAVLLWDGPALGAFVGMCGFVPMVGLMMETLDGGELEGSDGGEPGGFVWEFGLSDEAARDVDAGVEAPVPVSQRVTDVLRFEMETEGGGWPSVDNVASYGSTPVFLGHGMEDDIVPLEQGKAVGSVLGKLGLEVEYREYNELGHWYSGEMLGDIVAFLESSVHTDQ